VKPLALELRHFGPYTQHTIDLAAFADDGIFLIHGDTGSGKSTILDAIAWALYGRGLGARERDDHLRSKSAGPDEVTAVTLTFSLGDRRYKLHRAMGFERAARRGGGVTRQPPEASLACVAGDPRFETVASPRKVDAEVERLLGLPYEQFTRIIVLPQGEFRDLLLARADDRERLLERLFGTELYKTIEAELREVEKGLERSLGEARTRLDAALRSVGAASRDDLAALRADVEARRAESEARVGAAEAAQREADAAVADARARAGRNRERAALREAEDALEAGAAVARAREVERADAERAALCDDAAARCARARERYVASAGALNLARAAHDAALRAGDDAALSPARERGLVEAREAARERRARLEHLRRELDELESTARALDAARAAREAAEAQGRDLARASEQASASQLDKQRALDEGRRAAQNEPAAVLRVEEVDRRVRALHARLALEEQVREVTRTLRAAERQCVAARGRLGLARADRERARTDERAALAAALARALVHGEACPVCGSAEHPSPAPTAALAGGDDEARAAERRHDEALAALGRAEADQAKLEGELDALTRQRDAQRDADGAAADELDEARRAAARALDDVRRAKRAADDAERSLASLARDQQRLAGARAQAERGAAEAAATLAQLEPRVEAARARLAAEGVDGATLAGSLDEARGDEARLDEALEATREARAAAESRRARTGAAVEHASRERDEAGRAVDQGERDLAEALAAHGFGDEAALLGARRSAQARAALRDAVAADRGERARVTAAAAALGPDEPAGDLVAREAAAVAARATLAEAQREAGSLDERAGQLAAVASRAASWAGDGDEAERRWRTARAVSDAVNGRHDGKTRLSRYVLLEQFDRVAACASARLDVMSDGRFALRRRESRQTGGEFELVVDDAYAGSVERPVATLSGGEMFMASLAMALGLSDVVQAWAGGVRVESLFVDEGFGTLDEEALDKAVSVLEQLGETRRMVGVVSHVPELRKRIPARLEVVRSERGAATRASLRGRHGT
jgi:exonuclease SbcC